MVKYFFVSEIIVIFNYQIKKNCMKRYTKNDRILIVAIATVFIVISGMIIWTFISPLFNVR